MSKLRRQSLRIGAHGRNRRAPIRTAWTGAPPAKAKGGPMAIMEKLAETQVPIHELIGRRWSPRAFSPRSVEPEKLLSVFEAARWASSASNEQPWAFMVATSDDPKNYEAMLGVLVDFNRGWANQAPVLILTL